MKILVFCSLTLFSYLLPTTSLATLYQFVLTVDEVVPVDDDPCGFPEPPVVNTFDCTAALGDSYVGYFETSVDPASLADGQYPVLPLDWFYLQIGDVVWDSNTYPNEYFEGYRDGTGDTSGTTTGLTAVGGEFTNLMGGVYGQADALFIDFFYIHGDGRWGATDSLTVSVFGNYTIKKVPLPATLTLVLLPFMGLLINKRFFRE